MNDDRLTLTPDRAQYRPDETVAIRVTLSGSEAAAFRATADAPLEVRYRVMRLADAVADGTLPLRPDGTAEIVLPAGQLLTEASGAAGFGVEAEVRAGGAGEARGGRIAVGSCAFDVAEAWWQAPRYGFLSDFGPDVSPAETAHRLDQMRRLHLNVVQFYDWMYAHHTYLPPADGTFVDPLGRTVSMPAVRERIDACRNRGMVPLAYGAVYGAERDYLDAHPEQGLYHGPDGPCFSLADLFYIMDFHASGWRDRLLEQYAVAVRQVGFSGIHVDQYGFPKWGWSRAAGRWIDVGAAFSSLIDAAVQVGDVIFNCVNDWPVEQVADSRQRATYIEVWPPNERYQDLHALIRKARQLAPDRQVILAAYLTPHDSLSALRLLTAAIAASGGFHLVAGEGSGILREGYYPRYGRLDDAAFEAYAAYTDFAVRYQDLMSDRRLRDVSFTHAGGINEEVCLEGAPAGPYAEPGTVWTIVREREQRLVLHLINLVGQEGDHWNAPHGPSTPLGPLRLAIQSPGQIKAVWTASPDGVMTPMSLPFTVVRDPRLGQVVEVALDRLDTWSIVVVERDIAG